MKFTVHNEAFQCGNCGTQVAPHPTSCRNHCTQCLFSMHLDANSPGDRLSHCHGLMEPFTIEISGKKGWQIGHRCILCGHQIRNITAEDDNIEKIIELTSQPQKRVRWKKSRR